MISWLEKQAGISFGCVLVVQKDSSLVDESGVGLDIESWRWRWSWYHFWHWLDMRRVFNQVLVCVYLT